MTPSAAVLMLGLWEAVGALLVCVTSAVVGRAIMSWMGLVSLSPPPGELGSSLADLPLQSSSSPRALELFLWSALGLSAASAALFVLALVGQLRADVLAMVFALMLLLALVHLWRIDRAPGRREPWPLPLPSGLVVWGFVCLLVGLVWWSVRPPGMWDDTSYHLPYARHYLEQGGLSVNPYLRFPLFPHHANLWFAAGLMAGSDVLAQVLASAVPTALTALGVFGVCQWLLSSIRTGCLAVALLMSAAPLHEALGYAYVDHLLMLFVWAAMVALALAAQAGADARRWIVLCGLLAGTAASTKTFGALVSVLIGFAILLMPGLRWRAAWPYALAVALSGLGWYVRSAVISGDPVHPLGGNLFGHYLWTAADLQAQHQEQATHGVARDWWRLPQGMVAAGLTLLLPAFLVPLHPRLRSVAWLAWALLFVAYALIWHTSTQVARYMTAVLPVGAVLVAALCWSLTEPLRSRLPVLVPLGRRAAQGLSGLVLVSLVVPLVGAFDGLSVRLAQWDATLAARSGHEIMRRASALKDIHGPRLVHVGYENAVYFFEGTAVGDWFGPGRYSQMLNCAEVCRVASPERMAEVLAAHQARMLAVNTARFKFDPKEYQGQFAVLHTASDGVLLALRRPSAP
jgi:hypothetical protein